MRIWMGWFILLLFTGAWWLTYKIVGACIKKGGPMRLLGIIISFLVGGGSILVGYFIGPIVGWLIMTIGGLVIVIGTWRSAVEPKPTKSQLEREWLMGLVGRGELDKSDQEKWDNMWVSAKEEAKRILRQDEADDYDRLSLVGLTLSTRANDSESNELLGELKKLKWQSTIKEAKRIIEQGEIDIHNKKEKERFGRVWLEVYGKWNNPEANELWPQLQKVWRDSETR